MKGSVQDIGIGHAVLWVIAYLIVMLFYTFMDVAVWRKVFPRISGWLNILTISFCIYGFCSLLIKAGYSFQVFSNVTFGRVISAVGCAVLLFLLLDKCLDSIFERAFPHSEQGYQETIDSLLKSPVTSLLQVCILAPFIEEVLMRGFVLGGLYNTYGMIPALLVSAFLFAILHFNLVQTLSAFICGLVLGILYIKTNSLFCCIIAHSGYNLISYASMIYLHLHK